MAQKPQLYGQQLYEVAEDIAIRAHLGQVDKAGEPYVTHPARVVQFVNDVLETNREVIESRYGVDEVNSDTFLYELYAVAWLHDVIEDSQWNEEDLRVRLIPESVIEAIVLLTKVPNEPNMDYYHRIKASPYARIVKLADLMDNSDPARISLIEDADTRKRLVAKYEKAFDVLAFPPENVDTSSIVTISASA